MSGLSNSEGYDNLRQQGETLKSEGMALAANARPIDVVRGQIALLEALLRSPTGECTLDDATADLAVSFPCGGKWRGQVPLRLAKLGIIEPAGYARSVRPSRHRGFLTRWRLVDREMAVLHLACLEIKLELENLEKQIQVLDEATKNLPAGATAAGNEFSSLTTQTSKELSNETV
jgi:hypothetical protein